MVGAAICRSQFFMISKILILGLITLVKMAATDGFNEDVFPCKSQIFCHGELLETVQKNEIFSESKEFVDMKIKDQVSLKNLEINHKVNNDLKFNEETILKNFGKLSIDDRANKEGVKNL